MFLEKVFTFILFLGPLVFFHELGHFFFARLFGVKVEVFSIGFGPKLFTYKKGDTEYALSLIPLGGYVKMFGDDPFNKESIPELEKHLSYNHKGKWARFWIVLGGPLTNFLLAFFIFYGLMFSGEKYPEMKLGYLNKASFLFQNGLRSGDVLLKLNDTEIYNPSDLALDNKTFIRTIQIRRKNENTIIKTQFLAEKFLDELMKHPPFLRMPIIVDKNGQKYILHSHQAVIDLGTSLEESFEYGMVPQPYFLIPVDAANKLKANMAILQIELRASDIDEAIIELANRGYWTHDLVVKGLNFNSPADKAGIKPNDILISLNKENVKSFEDLRERLQKATAKEVELEIIHEGNHKLLKLVPEEQEVEGKKLKLLGVFSGIEPVALKFVKTKSKGFFGSFYFGTIKTLDSIHKMVDGLMKLITNQVSFKSVGGVLTIGKVANESLKISLSYFMQLMALISINLGVINLFPMLPLDGGHILFIFLELINRGPVSRRKMEITQQIGLSLLLMLMVGSIFNDVSKFF